MPREIQANETTAAQRRVYFFLVGTDLSSPALGEAGGQPQVSYDGKTTLGGAADGWTNTGVGTLVAIGNGRYYAELTQAAVATPGTVIESRYKSATTAECPGDTVQVVGFDPASFVPDVPVVLTPSVDPARTTAYLTTRDGRGLKKPGVTVYFRLIDPAGAVDAYERTNFAVTSDADGLLQVELKKVSQYAGRLGTRGDWVTFTTGSDATYPLPEILGSHGS